MATQPFPPSAALVEALEVQRVRCLFDRLPSLIVAMLIGVLLIFVFLLGLIGQTQLQAWAAFMLSAAMLRAWLWYMFRQASPTLATVRRWEYAGAMAGFISGLGWAALNGPLYPPPPLGAAHSIILLTTVAAVFSAAAFNCMSRLTFWAVLVPTLAPIVARQVYQAHGFMDSAVLAPVAILAAAVTMHGSLYRMLLESLRQGIESQTLLAEQQAIFQSATLGIAVVGAGRILKCNPRLADLLGVRCQELTGAMLNDYFVSAAELAKLLDASAVAFHRRHPCHGIFRLRRADGGEFWAEFSGNALLDGQEPHRSVWMITEIAAHGPTP